MVKLSAFADEIGDDLELQIDVLKKTGVGNIELRGVWGKNVLTLSREEVERIAKTASDAGIGFSAIGSPLGKFPLDGDFQLEIDGVKRALEYAEIVGAPYIRIFSYFIPEGDDPSKHRNQVHDWLGKLIEVASETDIVLAHENEKGIYGDSGERCLDLLSTLSGPSFTGAFDFSNFVVHGDRVYEECWLPLKKYISYFHIKDTDAAKGLVVPAGEGDGEVERILAEAYAEGFDNFLTLEPHLSIASANYGRTDPALFETAVNALTRILKNIGTM